MRQSLTATIDNIIIILLLIVTALTPLFFLNQMTEFYEIPKLVFLIVSTTLLLGLWIFSWILKGKVVLTRTPIDIPLLILLVVIIASAYFSPARNTVIYGNFPRVHGSVVSWVLYIILYFVTVAQLKNITQIKAFLYALYAGGILVSIISLLSYFHLYLPFSFAQAANFSPTGSTFSTVALLLLLLPLPLLSLVNPNKYLPMPVALVSAILFGITCALLTSLPGAVVLALVIGLSLFVTKPTRIKKNLMLFLVPVIVTGVVFALSFMPFPGNPIGTLASSFPKEIQLPLTTSWKIAASAFRDSPFLGTGPSTFLYNFTAYKPIEFNSNSFWNFSFDTAFNEFLQAFATWGLLGLIALTILCAVVVRTSMRNLAVRRDETTEANSLHILLPALAISALTSVLLLFIHGTTLVSVVVMFFIFAALMAAQKSVRDRVFEFSLGIKAATSDNRQFDLLPVIFFVIFLVGAAPLLYRTYNATMADYYHYQALASAGTSGTATYENLQKAERLNPMIDMYRVDLAQTNFALANAIVAQRGPSQASAAGSLTDQDRKTIQTLLSQSISEGRAAVALAPKSSRNREVLGSLYRNITGVAQNALAYSLDSYGRAIQLDPLNPALRLSVGGIYYSVRNYDLAIRFFSDAANLKPDYANAYFNLSVALKDKGDLTRAQVAAEQVVSILSKTPENPSYKSAAEYLKNLKAIIATNSAATADKTTAPAAQTNSALQGQNVPGVTVPDLNNPPQVATPAAVQSNPNATVPAASSAPVSSPAPSPAQ